MGTELRHHPCNFASVPSTIRNDFIWRVAFLQEGLTIRNQGGMVDGIDNAMSFSKEECNQEENQTNRGMSHLLSEAAP